ncbi:MAG: cysteine--tRNA ligase [Candidatus Krumholzibacteria bacterium]
MTLRVYDTLRGKKVEFKPVSGNKVGIYFCGMTVQDKPHMGHMLAFVSGDMIRRYLEHKGYEVTYVQNFTDIDDKIINKANDEGLDYQELAERNIEAYFAAANDLNIKPASLYPRATEHIQEMIDLIANLVEKDYAYAAGGDVYYRVRNFDNYGKLSKRKIDDLMSGARIAVGEEKEDPLDFALWKGSKPGEPGWDTPWGRGRPGWHIECSAMAMKYLGVTLDFHGGGEDLIFPHHENELAQSEAVTGCTFVNFWLHNGLLNLRGEKMSKSTGHFFAMDEVLKDYPGEVVRFYLLSTHFRSQNEYSRERLEDASRGFERLRLACVSIGENLNALGDSPGISSPAGNTLKEAVAKAQKRFLAAMDDDFNSAGAIGAVFDLVRTYYKLVDKSGETITKDGEALGQLKDAIVTFDKILGLFAAGVPTASEEIPEDVAALVEARRQARQDRDFEKADALRDQVSALGYIVEDRPDGERVRRK